VTAKQIAEVALAIGLEHATIRNVAARLDMSVPGLRHHVRTREDLVAMAAAHSLEALPFPDETGQPWTEWLEQYARYVYDALVTQPELIGQIMAGTVNTLRMAQHLERFFEVLAARGFTVAEADAAYHALTSAITGAAANMVGRRAATEAGHPRAGDLTRAVKALGADAVPLVDELVRSRRKEADPFDGVHVAIAGLAAMRP
jgi:AcrR family transcriptional regulator